MIDANRMPGATAMAASMDRAVKLANASGIGLCSVRNITHAGAIGYFGLRAAAGRLYRHRHVRFGTFDGLSRRAGVERFNEPTGHRGT